MAPPGSRKDEKENKKTKKEDKNRFLPPDRTRCGYFFIGFFLPV